MALGFSGKAVRILDSKEKKNKEEALVKARNNLKKKLSKLCFFPSF